MFMTSLTLVKSFQSDFKGFGRDRVMCKHGTVSSVCLERTYC